MAGFVERARDDGAKVVVGGEVPGGDLARGAYYAADSGRRRRPGLRDRPGRDLRPGARGAAVRLRRRGARAGQRHAVRPGRLGVDPGRLRPLRATREISAGCVWVNDHIPIISEMPHGGYKASGFGKDMSAYSFDEYTHVKHVMYDLTAVARKPWHRTIFGDRNQDRSPEPNERPAQRPDVPAASSRASSPGARCCAAPAPPASPPPSPPAAPASTGDGGGQARGRGQGQVRHRQGRPLGQLAGLPRLRRGAEGYPTLEAFRRRPASRPPTPRTSTTTTPTTARSRASSRTATTSARTSSSSPTGWPAG